MDLHHMEVFLCWFGILEYPLYDEYDLFMNLEPRMSNSGNILKKKIMILILAPNHLNLFRLKEVLSIP